MKTRKIIIENLKCHGCANTITREIGKIEGVQNLTVGMDDHSVNYDFKDENDPAQTVLKRLKSLGYPQAGSNSTINKAKSYVSCAIGRMNKDEERK